MDTLLVPAPVREKLGDAGSDGLVMMFADEHRITMEDMDRTVREVEDRFEHRLAREMSTLRLDMADLKADILKWNFLFWIGQLAAMTAVLSLMLGESR